MGHLTGKVAVVTGGSSGIGRVISERLAGDGAAVVLNYGHDASKADEVVRGIQERGGKALAVRADLGVVAEVRGLFEEALQRLGRLDILVNSAGVAHYKSLTEASEEDFEKTFAVNTRGVFFALQEAARRMAEGGRIVSLSTGGTRVGSPGASFYAGSKAAVEQFSTCLAKELGARNITVNVVSPGFTDTPLLAANPQFKDVGARLSPFGRLGRPEEIANVVAFLVTEEASWVTGQNIAVNGGVS